MQAPAAAMLAALVAKLPESGLVVDYTKQMAAGDFGLRDKAELEARAMERWREVRALMAARGVDVRGLAHPEGRGAVMDDALDAILGAEAEFLDMASSFQRALDLARPLRTIPKGQRAEFEVFMMLAHRARTLTGGGFSAQFLNTYADDTFFLNDNREIAGALAEAAALQRRAGHANIARALLRHRPPRGRWLATA